MRHQVQHGQALFKRGSSLIEIIAATALMAVILSGVMGYYKIRVDRARLERTVTEMMSLAQASRDYENAEGAWPQGPGNLFPGFMYRALTTSPFGSSYQISGLNGAVSVSTQVPSGLARGYDQGALLQIQPGVTSDTLLVTQGPANEISGRMQYEKRYVE